MHFKISEDQVKDLTKFAMENLLTKHGAPILNLLGTLPKIEEVVKEVAQAVKRK